ncbi:MAG: tetratricopeptide repeat protein [Nitrospirae bacterium]|nr:MAG: tetratricopeptide repeat protein [Nitrospirota bacterium]
MSSGGPGGGPQAIANASLLAALEPILAQAATGVLTSARVGAAHRKLQVVEGQVVGASALAPEERLLARLAAAGHLNPAQREEVMQRLAAGERGAGRLVVKLGMAPEAAVVEQLAAQIRDALAALLADPAHPVRFIPTPGLAAEPPCPRIPMAEAVAEALLALPEETLRSRYPLGPEACFRPALEPWPLAERFPFDEAAAACLGLVEPGRPLAEVARLAGLAEGEARRRLFLLAYLGLITPDGGGGETRAGEAAATGAAPGSEAAAGGREAPEAEAAEAELSEEARAVAAELRGLARRLAAMDPFQLLRVNRHHSEAEVKRSYHRLSKRLHPDVVRGLGLPEELVEVAGKVHQAMSAAYQALSDPKQRAALLRQAGAPERPRRTDPEAIFANAKAALNARDPERAARLLENLIERQPDRPEYHVYLAAACVQLRGRKREAEQALKRAIRLAPTDATAYVALGDLYREGGMAEKAASCYREALRWNPNHRHAKQWLERLEAEERDRGRGLGGLLGRLRRGG